MVCQAGRVLLGAPALAPAGQIFAAVRRPGGRAQRQPHSRRARPRGTEGLGREVRGRRQVKTSNSSRNKAINGKKYTLASQHLATNLLLLRHKAPQPPDRSAEHRIVGRRRGAAGARARAALGPVHRPHDESRRRWSLLDRVRAQQELHDRHGGALVGGGVVLGARGGVDAAPGHMRF
jgi:hypothetical protein